MTTFNLKAILTFALVILTLPVSALAESEESAAVIQVRPVIEVDGQSPEITLGDIIATRGIDSEKVEALAKVRLADTPQPGESRSFTAFGIEQIFRTHLRPLEEQLGEQVVLRVPRRVTIVRKALQLRPEDIESEIKNQLKAICSDCEFEIQKLNLPATPPTISSGAVWKLKLRPELPKGSFSIPLEVTTEDSVRRTYWITGVLAVKRLVPVASRQIMMGEKIRPEDYQTQLKEVTFATDAPALTAELETSTAARQVAAGEVIWRSQLRREQAIKFGDLVKVTTGSEAWQISIDGVAQGSGYIGDRVRVKIPRTQKVLSGLLKDKGVVEVQ